MSRLPIVIIALSLAAGAADAGPYRAPRTAFGAPDLQGLWTNTSLTFLQRPTVFKALVATDKEAAFMETMFRKMVGDLISPDPIDPKLPAPPVVKEAPQTDYLEMDIHLARLNGQLRSSWIVDPADGRLPFSQAGKAIRDQAIKDDLDGPEGRPTEERCLTAIGSPEGPPMMNTGFNGHYQIVQTPGYVVIHIEMNHDLRIIRMGQHTHLPAPLPASIRPWMGDSVGWWDGETLVVETTNMNPKSYVGSLGGGFPYSAPGRLTERFTRTAKDQMLYQFSVDDPGVFTKIWRAEMPMRAAKGPIYEYACHEGNYSLPNILEGARAMARAAPAQSSSQLSR